MDIIPGILEKEWSEIEKKIELVRPFAKTIHIDIIDGKFAPNATFLDPAPFKKYARSSQSSSGQALFFELHMMVEDPISYLQPWADAGFARFLGHVESLPKLEDQAEFVAAGQLLGEVGLAIDVKTPASAIKVPFEDLDSLLVMGVPVGFSGQKFDPSVLDKLKEITENTFVPVGIDGGINADNIFDCQEAGATQAISTSFLFSGNPQEQFQKLQSILGQ